MFLLTSSCEREPLKIYNRAEEVNGEKVYEQIRDFSFVNQDSTTITNQTFDGKNFVICSFCPRLFDYHPQAIPAPYNHSNIDSDEVLYYVDGDFMSRAHVEKGMFTLHPGGIPHGPHPGTAEKSIGVKETHELAVMVDTFYPLKMTEHAYAIEDKDYYKSWL